MGVALQSTRAKSNDGRGSNERMAGVCRVFYLDFYCKPLFPHIRIFCVTTKYFISHLIELLEIILFYRLGMNLIECLL